MYLLKSNTCSYQLDVQETNVSIPQLCRIRDGLLALDLWDVVIEVLRNRAVPKRQPTPQQETVCEITTPNHPKKRKPRF